MKRKRIAAVIAASLILLSAGIYFYYGFLFKEARNIATEVPDINIDAKTLLKDYSTDPEKANSLYLNKTIQITGQVTKLADSEIVLENSVFCLFIQKITAGLKNKKVTLKGKCIGYDELFQEVKLDQCTIIKPNN